VPQPEPSRLRVNRLHEEPADAAATQRLVHHNVVNMPDRAETSRRYDGQRRGRDKHIILLSHDQDEPVIANRCARTSSDKASTDGDNWASSLRSGANRSTRFSGARTAVVVSKGEG